MGGGFVVSGGLMTEREKVESDPWYSAYRHARRLVMAEGLGRAMACFEAKVPEREYARMDQLYRALPPVKHSDTRPHETYGDAELPPALRGLVHTTKEPTPLPADWAPPSRPETRRLPHVEDEMGKGRSRPPWRRGVPGIDPANELDELVREVEVPVEDEVQLKPHHPMVPRPPALPADDHQADSDLDGELEDAAAVENTEEEQDQMARGELEEPKDIQPYGDITPQPLDVEFRFEEPKPVETVDITGNIPGIGEVTVLKVPAEVVEDKGAAYSLPEDVGHAWCRQQLEYQGVSYTCIKQAHSPLVGHEYAPDEVQEKESAEEWATKQGAAAIAEYPWDNVPLTAEGDHQILQEEATADMVDEEFDRARAEEESKASYQWANAGNDTREDGPEFEPVEIEPDLPADEPTPIAEPLPEPKIPEEMAAAEYEPPPPAPEEVEAQKEKALDRFEQEHGPVVMPKKDKPWPDADMEFARQMTLQGYGPGHFSMKRLSQVQRDAVVKHAQL
jgi:hypothetical protein